MYNFVTEQNLRFFKCWKTLNDYFNTILSPKINDFYTKHNNDVTAYAAQVAAAGT
jgi:SUMO ligase MMS21 Smc5/6 complex component